MANGLKLKGLQPDVRAAAAWTLDVADYYGVPVTVTSTKRSWLKQYQLYRRYQAGQSRFPANPPGQSSHEYGLSFDSTVPEEFIPWWTMVRWYAGFRVPPNDWIHAEAPNWRARVGR